MQVFVERCRSIAYNVSRLDFVARKTSRVVSANIKFFRDENHDFIKSQPWNLAAVSKRQKTLQLRTLFQYLTTLSKSNKKQLYNYASQRFVTLYFEYCRGEIRVATAGC